MIEEVKIEDKKGIGWTVVLGWMPGVNLLVLFSIFRRASRFPKLKSSPNFWFTDEVSFGSASVWGVIYLFFGGICLIGYLSALFKSEPSAVDGIIIAFFFMVLPFFLIGISLRMCNVRYERYISAIDEALSMLRGNVLSGKETPVKSALAKSFQYGDREMSPEETSMIWEDLQKNYVITYVSKSQTNELLVKVIAPELQKYFAGQKTTSPEPSFVANQTEWQCEYCGGKNEIKKDEKQKVCTFCGASSG